MGKRLNREPNGAIWRALEELEIDAALSDIAAGVDELVIVERLVDRYLILAKHLTARSSNRSSGVIPPDSRAEALGAILAIDARRRGEVKAFRADVLRGKLVQPGRVQAWIKRQSARDEKDNLPTMWVRLPVHDDGTVVLPRAPLDKDSQADVLEELRDYYRHTSPRQEEKLTYAVEGQAFAPQTFIRLGGVLHRLKQLAEMLQSAYGWPEAHGVFFSLTDWTPPLSMGNWTARGGNHPFPAATERITLTVSTRLKPRDIARFYSEARGTLRTDGLRSKGIQAKSASLAIFAFRVNDGRTWNEAMSTWNKENPEHLYDRRQLFARDCRQAFEKIAGARLDWQGARR